MPSIGSDNLGPAYWRSLDELADTPAFRAFVEREFPVGATEWLSGPSRRQFLKVMGASFALAGLAACRWPEERIVPHVHRPEGHTPGVPERYATAMERSGVATGLLVTSYDGRPIKVEGNPLHPDSRGATDALAQASILELYDPDRSQRVVRCDGGQRVVSGWEEFGVFAQAHFSELKTRQGDGLAILSEATASPSVAAMQARLREVLPKAAWYDYKPVSRDNERAGARLAFGEPLRMHLALDEAAVIACFDADLLLRHPAAVGYTRDFAEGRARCDEGRMSRLYVAESSFSLTGGMADHRLAVRSGDVPGLVAAVAAALADEPVEISGAAVEFVRTLVADLKVHAGRGIVVAGASQPPEVHALVHQINHALGNAGKTVRYTVEPDAERPSHVEAIAALAAEIEAGRVKTLLILGGNPAYDAPADLRFGELIDGVATSIHLSLYENETSQRCTWHLPRAHWLEAWGDTRGYDGTVAIAQPLIAPLYDGKSVIEVLALVLDEPAGAGYEIVRRTFSQLRPGSDETAWREALHDGVLPGTGYALRTPALRADLSRTTLPPAADNERIELTFESDASVYDGRFANNGWLQEMPDPLTKLTWDNAALVGPATAAKLGIRNGDMIELTHEGRSVEIVAHVMPGQAPDSIAVALGYGRTAAGRVGDGVGFNVYPLRTTATMHRIANVAVKRTGRAYALATTQDHHALDRVGLEAQRKRVGTDTMIGALVRETTLAHYTAHPDAIQHAAHESAVKPLWADPVRYDGYRWAMAIDLNRCTGCGACVVACQAENNIPIVGKAQVARGREMHWLRIDRYFKGDPASPAVAHQPVACVHCEDAPCEQVCPVAATVHDHDGLNVMIYNRCVGTRYCSNNCPFKVRRFNYFNNHKALADTEKMAFNPDVTVRSRGVMEKCTFCTQRIQAAKIAAKNERRSIADGEIVPACAQACPAQAIVFGDLNNEESAVARLFGNRRAYAMLAELNIRPRTVHLARIRNTAGEGDDGNHEHSGH